ncbi:MAG: SDR family oxidoreductase, partial [Umezawaea sp.]
TGSQTPSERAEGFVTPIGRTAAPDEVAGAIAYLASPLSGSTAGTILAVDGGMHGLRLRPQV